MPSESSTWSESVRPVLLGARLDPHRVENPSIGAGTPDVNYVEGWIELKYRAEWPKRQQTAVTIDHFTPQQRVWLGRRWRNGGRAFLLLRVEREFLLFDGMTAQEKVGLVSRVNLYAIALHREEGFSVSFLPHLLAERSKRTFSFSS